GFAVPAELDEGVAEYAVVAGGIGAEADRPASKRERFTEAVASERERAQSARRRGVVRSERGRASKRVRGLRVVDRIPCLSGPLLIGKSEQGIALRVPGPCPQVCGELADEGRRVARRESRIESLGGSRALDGDGPSASGRLAEDTADEEDGGGKGRH